MTKSVLSKTCSCPVFISQWGRLSLLFLAMAFLESNTWADLPRSKASVRDLYHELPLSFEPNYGQTDSAVQFLSRGPGFWVFLADGEAVLNFRISNEASTADPNSKHMPGGITTRPCRSATLRMKLLGAEIQQAAHGVDQLPGVVNYFVGNDPNNWRNDVPTFAKVKFPLVYPGVDLIYYGNGRQLEYDFVVAPGSNPDQITLAFEGAEGVSVDDNGDLVACLEQREVRFRKPVIYQRSNGSRREISGGYRINGSHAGIMGEECQVSFAVGEYDRSLPLVIDPVTIAYSTHAQSQGQPEAHRALA